jgi:hypothetical protein
MARSNRPLSTLDPCRAQHATAPCTPSPDGALTLLDDRAARPASAVPGDGAAHRVAVPLANPFAGVAASPAGKLASRPHRFATAAALAGLVALLGPSQAGARAELSEAASVGIAAAPLALLQTKRTLSYPYEHVWPASIRYLRVDRGFKITDKDEEAGYIMFEFTTDAGEAGSGALELVGTEDPAGRPSTSLAAMTNGGPSYLSNSLLDGVAAKVRDERGPPAAPPKKAPPEPPPPPPEIDPDGPKGEEPGYPPGPAPKEKGRRGRR